MQSISKEDIMKEVEIYTDGACRGNPGPGGWGAILVYGEHKKELSDALYDLLEEGDVILFKASRGMALEDVINSLYERIK